MNEHPMSTPQKSPDTQGEALTSSGIAGNLTLDEANALARGIGATAMIAHHYGMFAFNTLEPERIDRFAADSCAPRVHRARTGIEYRLS